MIQACITPEQLRAALKEVEAAERNGFKHCLAVFRLSSTGFMLSDTRMEYSDLWDKAHPTDGRFDWGRQGVSKRCKFKNGKLHYPKTKGSQ